MAIIGPDLVVIEEIGVPDPIRIELGNQQLPTDAPFGRAREIAAFESGGVNEIPEDGIYLPGSNRVVYQVLYSKNRPLILKGAFRDNQTATTGHARAMRDQIEEMRARANLVDIRYEADSRIGILKEAKFGEEGQGDITYELTFLIAQGPANKVIPNRDETPPSMLDTLADMQLRAAETRAEALAQALPADIRLGILTSLDDVTGALNDLNSKVEQYEDIALRAPDLATAALNGVANAVHTSQQLVKTALNSLDSLSPADLVTQTASAAAGWWDFQFGSRESLREALAQLRSILQQAQARQRTNQKVYEVRDGDTLEDIALLTLGSRGRAGDLGVREDQLRPGLLLTIPSN